MAHTAYTYQLKSVECDQCGGPVVAEAHATEARCGFCNAPLRLVVRPKDVDHAPIDEAARIAGLRAQVSRQDPNGPLSARPPDGMHAFAEMLTKKDARAAAVEALRQEWEQARAEATAQPSRQSGTRAFRAAFWLARFYAADDEDGRARAVAETAINLVSDAGQRDILRLFLARAALDAGDVEAYAAWLADANPQPVHIEVDTALRLTRAKKALVEGAWGDVFTLVGSYPSEVPLAQDDDRAARFLRAHAHAGRGDEVSARRELRGALATASDAPELVRILLDAYPGPAADIAREEAARPHAAAWGAQVTAPARAAAHAEAASSVKAVRRTGGAMAGLVGCMTFLPMLLFLVPMLVPSLFFRACGMDGAETEVIEMIDACPSAAAALGDDVSAAPGLSCGNIEMSDGSGYADWSFAVSGSEGRGTVSFVATKHGGVWKVENADLDIDGRNTNLVACGNAARMGLDADEVTVPGLLQGFEGVLGLTGALGDDPSGQGDESAALNIGAAMLEARCDGGDMQSCYALGTMYQTMEEIRDEAKAEELLERACEGGHSGACSSIGR